MAHGPFRLEEEQMPSQLFSNDKISFIVTKPLLWRDHEYSIGDDFPQEEANNIETLVRSRFLAPVVDSIEDKPRHWHREVQLRETVLAKINGEVTQIVLPSQDPTPASDPLVPTEQSPEPTQVDETDDASGGEGLVPEGSEPEPEAAAEAVHSGEYDPSYHTVAEVNAYMEQHPDEREAIIEREQDGKNRKGIVEGY